MERKKSFWVKYSIFRILPLTLAAIALIFGVKAVIELQSVIPAESESIKMIVSNSLMILIRLSMVLLGVWAVLQPFDRFSKAEDPLKIGACIIAGLAVLWALWELVETLEAKFALMDGGDAATTFGNAIFEGITVTLKTAVSGFVIGTQIIILLLVAFEKTAPKFCKWVIIIKCALSLFEVVSTALSTILNIPEYITINGTAFAVELSFYIFESLALAFMEMAILVCVFYLPIRKAERQKAEISETEE